MSKTQHEIRIEAVYKDLMSQGLVKSQRTIDAFAKRGRDKTDWLHGGFVKLRGGVSDVGRSLTSATAQMVGFGAAVAAVGKGVQVFLETEKAMAEVATISDKVASGIGAVSDEVGTLALRFGLAESAVAKGLYQTISSGVTEPAEALETLNVALGLSIAGIADSTETTDLLVSTLNAFGSAAGSATHVADVMFSTVRQGKTTIAELAGSLSQVTPVAAALGVSMEETASAVAAVTLSGAGTSEAVTQVSAVLTALQKKSSDVDEALRERGMAGGFNLARLRAEGLLPIVRDLREAYQGNEDELTNLLGRVEATNAVFNLAGDNLQRFQTILDENTNSAGAYADALDTMASTASQRVASMMEGMRQGLADLGEAALSGLVGEDGLQGGLDAAEASAAKLKQTLSDLGPLINAAAKVIKQMADAVAAWSRYSDSADLSFQSQQMRDARREWETGTGSLEDLISKTSDYMDTYRRLGRVFDEDDFLVQQLAIYVDLQAASERLAQRNTALADGNVLGEPLDQMGAAATGAKASIEDLYNTWVQTVNMMQFGGMAAMGVLPGAAPAPAGGGTYTPGQGPPVPGPGSLPPAAPWKFESGDMQGPQPGADFQPWDTSGGLNVLIPDVDGGGNEKGPVGAAKAWADLHEQVKMTDDKAEEFTARMISDLGHDATNAIMDFATGAASAEEAFANFASSFLLGMAEMITQQLVFNAISSSAGLFGFADGGTAEGGMSLFANGGVAAGGLGMIGYANGGPIVTKPHLAMVGEGHYDEAVVPLTGGGSIPVQIAGGGGGAQVTINVQAMDGADATRVLMKNSGAIRAIFEEALMTTQSTRNAVRQVQ